MRVTASRMRAGILFLAVFTALISTRAASQPAVEGRSSWGILRVQGLMTLPAGNDHAEIYNDCGTGLFDFLNFSASINVNTSGGMLGSFEYVFKRKYGVELAFNWWRQIIDISFGTENLKIEGTPNFILPTLGFNYHFLPDSNTDLYLGAMATLGIIASGAGTDIEVNKSVALGLNLGFDYYLSEWWFIGGTAKIINFGEMEFSLLPPGISGIICDNGLFGIGNLSTLSLTCGGGFRF